MLDQETKEEFKEAFMRIRENKLLVSGILIGIIGSLIAGVINDLIKETSFYPWIYLIILIILTLIPIYMLLRNYILWKRYEYHINKKMKKYKRAMDMIEEHQKKYPSL